MYSNHCSSLFPERQGKALLHFFLTLLHCIGFQQRPHNGSQGGIEPSLLLMSSCLIKDHAPCGGFILMVYVAVVLITHFHFVQPLLEDLHVLWHNANVQ